MPDKLSPASWEAAMLAAAAAVPVLIAKGHFEAAAQLAKRGRVFQERAGTIAGHNNGGS